MGIGAAVGGAIASGLGVEAGVATTIAGGMLVGAGTGALGSAITGGDPLKGALMGGVMGGASAGIGSAFSGAGDAAASSALDSAGSQLGSAQSIVDSGVSSAAPAGGLDAYGGSAASLGGASSGLGSVGDVGSLGSSGAGLGSSLGSDSLTNGLFTGMNGGYGGATAPTPGGDGAGAGTGATSTSGNTLGTISQKPLSTYDPLSQAAGPTASSSASDAAGISGTTKDLGAIKGAAIGGGAKDSGILSQLGLSGISKADVLKGVLSMGANLLGGSPKQGTWQTPGPASTAATQGPYFNQPLQPYTYTGPSRTQVAPAPTGQFNTNPSGVMPTYFANNSLANYGFGAHARGGPIHGARSMAHGGHEAPAEGRVRGPGSGISDDVPAMLSNDEYVLTARDVSTIGGGSSEEGAKRLDAFRQQLHRTANKKQFLDKRTEGALDRFSHSLEGRRHG